MENDLKKVYTYNRAIENVWDALSTPGPMRVWYFPQLINFTPVAGSYFQFKEDSSLYKKEWQVTDVIVGRKLSHSWTYKGYTGASEVSFELFGDGNKTRLQLTHTGLDSFPKDPHFARQRFEDGWDRILGINLKNLLENK